MNLTGDERHPPHHPCQISGRISYHLIIPVKYQVENQQHHEVSHIRSNISNAMRFLTPLRKLPHEKTGEGEGAPFPSRKDRGCGGSATFFQNQQPGMNHSGGCDSPTNHYSVERKQSRDFDMELIEGPFHGPPSSCRMMEFV